MVLVRTNLAEDHTMTTKTYAARDSATSALRKIGLQARDYNLFITKVGDKFECKLGAAAAHLDSLKNPKPVVEAKAEAKPVAAKEPKTTKAGRRDTDPVVEAKPKKMGISATARELILSGKTNQEVWEVLQQQFNLNDSKKHYPTWYRCEMKRTGLLPKED
jgi:hypothetical protein